MNFVDCGSGVQKDVNEPSCSGNIWIFMELCWSLFIIRHEESLKVPQVFLSGIWPPEFTLGVCSDGPIVFALWRGGIC